VSASADDRVIRAAVGALALAAFASGITQRSMDALLPRLAEDFGVSLGAVAGVITAFTIGYAAMQPFFGPIGDRHGKYLVIAWSCAACTLAALLCALAPDLSWLLAGRVFAGAMGAATIPLAMAWIGDVIPYERRQPVLAQFLVGQILGVAAGQLIGGVSADHLGRRAPFLIAAVLFAVSTALLLRIRRRLPAAALGRQARGASGGLRHVAGEYREILRLPWARVVLLSAGVEGAMVFGAFAFFAAHLHATLGVSLTTAGVLVMPFGLGGLVFALGTRQLLGRLGELGLARAGGALMLAAACVIALAPGIVTAAAACFAMGLGFYMLHNTLQTNATQMAPERRGAAVSAFAFSYFLGQSIGVSIAGWAVSRVGTATVIVVAALGIAAIAASFARRKRLSMLQQPAAST
jgi:predicted MFS family arabinose efflux permease